MSFFIRGNNKKTSGKRSKNLPSKRIRIETGKGSKKLNGKLDENISSDSELSDVNDKAVREYSSDEEETAQEKRLRLAKQYIEEIEREEKERAEGDEISRDIIAHRLKEDVLEQTGRLQKKIAEQLIHPNANDAVILKGHQRAVTCVVVSSDCRYIFSGSKDCTIIKWSVEEKSKVKKIARCSKDNNSNKGHSDNILCLAISTDNKFLASGCKSKIIHIWDPMTMAHIHTFTGHRDAVSGLAFRKNSHQLFSASFDRSVKIWNLEEMAYVETLFGHQDTITSIDSLTRDRALTSGGRDNSLRIWKVVEESQLIFNGHTGIIECVRFINDDHFLSCGDDGMLSIWGVLKKKPLTTFPSAHGQNLESGEPNWIISVSSFQNTDLIASGSNNGYIKLWKCSENFRNIMEICSLPMDGHVNSLAFANNGSFLVAGLGQDHRLGRWLTHKKAKNSVILLPLNYKL